VPSVDGSTLFASLSHEYEMMGAGLWPIIAVDLAKASAGEEAILWRFQRTGVWATFGSLAVSEDLLYAESGNGLFLALDRQTGREIWRRDSLTQTAYFTSPTIIGDRVFFGTDDGYLYVYARGSEAKCLGCFEFDDPVSGTPIIVDDTLYITTSRYAWALHLPQELR
jgi:outer membrane protein assembly factor BamB